MTKRPIRIAVAGLGRIGWCTHCARLAESPDFELAAVADMEPERRAEAEEVHGCRAYADVETMLDKAQLDVVVIATPTHLHRAHSLAAFRRGLHVYLEKPMALDLAEARSIARAARRAKRVLSVYQPHRAKAWFQQVLRLVASGRLGEVYHVRVCLSGYRRRDDWQGLKRFGGGMLANYGAHAMDLALALTGSDVRKVFCNLRRVATLGDAEDVVKAIYETRAGKVGEIDINQACALPPPMFEAFGTLGAVRRDSVDVLTVRYFSRRQLKPKKLNSHLASAGRKYPDADIVFTEKQVAVNPRHEVDVYKDLARAIRTGSPPFIEPPETLAVMKLMERCRAEAGRIVSTLV
jgi:predicted dehydrogenase